MSNINKHLTIDDLDRDTTPPDAVPLVIRPELRRPEDWRAILARGGVGVVAGGLGWWLFGHDVREWLAYGAGAPLATLVPYGAALLGSLYAAKRILTDRVGGVELRSWRNNVSSREIIGYAGRATEAHAARQFPHVSSYSPSVQQLPARGEVIEGQIVDAPTQITVPSIQALPASEWLAWFDTRPHGLLAAETGGGKSTTAKAVLGSRIERGELVFILDPHSSDWFGLPGIGGGEDWGAVWVGMRVVIQEYRRRLAERDTYLHVHGKELAASHFPRITVLLDEANLACSKLDIAPKRGEATPWQRFVETLGSGARKVNISILMLAQSPNVEDIGLSGPMRQNFTRLALDAATTRLMTTREETDAQRKKDILATLADNPYPATSVQRGRVIVLDRTGLDRYPTPHNPSRALWIEGYERVEDAQRRHSLVMPVQRATVAHSQASATLRATASLPPQDDMLAQYHGMAFVNDAARIGWLAYYTKLGTREIREIVGCKYNVVVAVAGNVRRMKAAKEPRLR